MVEIKIYLSQSVGASHHVRAETAPLFGYGGLDEAVSAAAVADILARAPW